MKNGFHSFDIKHSNKTRTNGNGILFPILKINKLKAESKDQHDFGYLTIKV